MYVESIERLMGGKKGRKEGRGGAKWEGGGVMVMVGEVSTLLYTALYYTILQPAHILHYFQRWTGKEKKTMCACIRDVVLCLLHTLLSLICLSAFVRGYWVYEVRLADFTRNYLFCSIPPPIPRHPSPYTIYCIYSR